jgi:hypothetical protein
LPFVRSVIKVSEVNYHQKKRGRKGKQWNKLRTLHSRNTYDKIQIFFIYLTCTKQKWKKFAELLIGINNLRLFPWLWSPKLKAYWWRECTCISARSVLFCHGFAETLRDVNHTSKSSLKFYNFRGRFWTDSKERRGSHPYKLKKDILC